MLVDTRPKQFSPDIQERPAVSSEHERELALMRRIAGGDEASLGELYAVHGQRMYAYALRLAGNPEVAKDIVQDTLVAVWQSAGRFRGDGHMLAWLLGIVHHTAMKALRHRSQPISDEMEETLVSPAVSPEERFVVKEQSLWVRRGLQSLSAEHRAVLDLVFYQGLSINEVAEVCHCPVGTVKSRLSYARKHLRGVLSREEKT